MRDTSYKRAVIKIGTNVLTQPSGLLDVTTISHLVDQIAQYKKEGIEVLLITSGAVGAGRSYFPVNTQLSKIVRRQVLASIGQVRLMQLYSQLFSNYNLFCAQVLATKEDFRDKRHYLNMQNCLLALLRDNIVPIINENDVTSVSELMFTDNDELAGMIASMTNADIMVLLSTVDGIFDGSPDDPSSKLITTVQAEDEYIKNVVLPTKSSFGRGGMTTKLRIARKCAATGTKTIIANGKRASILMDILSENYVGTTFVPHDRISNVKKRLAYVQSDYAGTVVINEGAVEVLYSKTKVASLLPIGIIEIEGNFEKGELVRILGPDGKHLGIGMAQYDHLTASAWMGKKYRKPLIRYDFMYLEE